MKKNQFKQSHGCFEESNQVPCDPNMTNHFLGTCDILYKHHSHQKSLKWILTPQEHETSWDMVKGEELDLCDNLCIHYYSRGFLVWGLDKFAIQNLQEDWWANH